MAVQFYNQFIFRKGAAQIDLSDETAGAFKVLLVTGYVHDPDHGLADITPSQIASGGGYTTGGQNATNVSWTQDNANDRAVWSIADTTWPSSTISATGVVVVHNATSTPILYGDFGGTVSSSNSEFIVNWPETGLWVERRAI